MINSKPAARQGDLGIHAVCCGPDNFTIAKTPPAAAAAVVSPGEVQVQVVGIDGTPQPGLEFELTLERMLPGGAPRRIVALYPQR